eukprot:TRINITY_DN187_c0_g2_i1.p1 TRINITY_DN187_c0_g2~~TRINITY_DN187_c0_g2_i1.p1  ORF type:complete len:443 (+),score=4.09 TRINITY_DN187_c0_g2_i1:79-1407(+)
MLVRFLLSVFLFFFCLSYVRSECIYVSKNGNDTWPGTEAQPYLTLQRAFITNETSLDICILVVPGNDNLFDGVIDLYATNALSIGIHGNGTESDSITIDWFDLETIIVRSITISDVTIQNAGGLQNFDNVMLDKVHITGRRNDINFSIWANKEITLSSVTANTEITLSAYSVNILNSQIHGSISIYAYDITKGLTISNSNFTFPTNAFPDPQFTIYSDLSISQTIFSNFGSTLTIYCYSDCSVHMDHVKLLNNNVTVISFVNIYNLNLVSVETTCYPDHEIPPFSPYSSQPLNIVSQDPISQCQIICDPGSYSPFWVAPCISCPAGTSKSVKSADNCKPCPPGTFAGQSGSTTCTPCPDYTFSKTDGSLWCSACDFGQKSNSNKTDCIAEPVNPTEAPSDPDQSFLKPLWICFGIWVFLFVVAVGVFCFMRVRSRDRDISYQ